jgi:hypothetical protein
MRTAKEIVELSNDIIESERANMLMMDGMYKMGTSLEWRMKDKPSWMREEISTDPFDALTDVADLFGAKSPKLAMTPYGGGEKNRKQAELIEKNLMWQLSRMFGRRGSVQKDIIRGAFQYGRIGAQLVYLPFHNKNMKIFTNEKRKRAAMRFGPFALINKDPRTVYPVWSDYMLEAVLNVTIQPLQEVVDFWGEKATKDLRRELKDEPVTKLVTIYDYWDYDQRRVWAHRDEGGIKTEDLGFKILEGKNELPFLPWIVEDIGSPLMPLLYPIWKTGKWDTMNINESALISEVIAYIAAPRGKIDGPNPRSVRQSFGTPQKNVEVPPGHEYTPLPPPQFDQNLTHMIDRGRAAISKSTIPHTVQTADFGSGTPFSSVRELIDLTTRRLNDGKATTERFFAEVFRQMLYWIDHTGDELTSYSDDEYDGGQIKIVAPKNFDGKNGVTFNTDALHFKVTLLADVPEDQVAKTNAATMALQLGVSPEKAMEMVDIADPAKEVERRHSGEIREANHQNTLQRIAADGQIEIQKMVQAQQQEAGGGTPGPAPEGPPSPAGNLTGQGANPALRGTPPAVGGGDVTRETAQNRGA